MIVCLYSLLCSTFSAVSWAPSGAFSWASGLDSLCEEGVVSLLPATSFSLASALDLSPSFPASVSFGRLGDACQKVRPRERRVNGRSDRRGVSPCRRGSKAHLCRPLCFSFSPSPLVLLVNHEGAFVLVAAALGGRLLRVGRVSGAF